MSNSFPEIPMTVLASVGGGRKSSSSNAEIKTLLAQTGDAIKDLARQSQNSSGSSDQMMPMMLMMMMRK